MIRILNVLHEERFGGPQARVLQVATRLRGCGIETLVALPKGDPAFASKLTSAQIPFEELDLVRPRGTINPAAHAKFFARVWPNVSALRRLIRKHQIQIVHANGLINLQAPLAARLEGVRLVWHLNDLSLPRWLCRLFLPALRCWADRIAVSSRAVLHHCFLEASFFQERIHVLYPPVDVVRFSPETKGYSVRQELGIPRDSPVIGTVANISPNKGIEFFLEAAAIIRQRFPRAKFVIVGELLENRRSYWSSLFRRAQEFGLASDVIFTGRRHDMPQVMAAMTVYVHSSKAEAGPMAVLEASATGLPVVVANAGGPKELIEDGITGFLVPPQSSSEIAEAVVQLLRSPEIAFRMGERGAERMRELFCLEVSVQEHIRLYTAALS